MNRKISLLIMALVLGAILVPCINADTQSINSKKIKTIDRPWENIKSTSYEGNRTLKIKIMRILMEDFIDVGDGILNWYADFKWHIHVDDEKQSGRGPLDQHDIDYWDECDAYKFTFKYDVAQKDEVTIRIELWDRDLILDEECDINGETKEKESVTFTYNLVTDQSNLSGTGGKYNSKDNTIQFDGDWDGTAGVEPAYDDNDAYMEVKVTDSYSPDPELSVSTTTLSWIDIDPNQKTENKTFNVSNNGLPGSILIWEIESKPSWIKCSTEEGKTLDLAPGEQQTVKVELTGNFEENKEYTENIVITSNGGEKTINLAVSTPITKPMIHPLMLRLLGQFPFLKNLL